MRNGQTVILDGVSFPLKEIHDFRWIHDYGEVFCVFDRQDSGNLSFAVIKDGLKNFVKYAGATPVNYKGKPGEAINKLKNAKVVYEALDHPHLVKLVEHREMEEGYVLVYEWFDGLNIQKSMDPRSSSQRFKQLPLEVRIKSLTTIFEFHVHVEKSNYVAIDFYDGSILYDFQQHKTKICDMDLYHSKPFYNEKGRLWGSSRFMSPEEFKMGAEIDARSNVFNMGAIAFYILGGALDRSYNQWEAGKELYSVARRAVEIEKVNRYSSIVDFFTEWKLVVDKEFSFND